MYKKNVLRKFIASFVTSCPRPVDVFIMTFPTFQFFPSSAALFLPSTSLPPVTRIIYIHPSIHISILSLSLDSSEQKPSSPSLHHPQLLISIHSPLSFVFVFVFVFLDRVLIFGIC